MTIKDFKERVSVRSYTNQKLTEQETKDLIEIINNAPTTNNSQPVSSILVTDKDGLELLGMANGGSKWVKDAAGVLVFLGDTTRNEHLVPRATDPLLKGNTKDRLLVDGTIAATYAQDGLIAMGFSSCFIGGLTRDPETVSKYLDLPDTAFIVTALVFGKAKDKNLFKPKVNKVYIGKYNKEKALKDIEAYNPIMKEYYMKRSGKDREFSDQLKSGTTVGTWKADEFMASTKYYNEIDERYKK